MTEYKYEYKFKCYFNCPERTYNDNYICEDCHEDCEKCNGPVIINNTNCISCSSKSSYLYFGNCIDECPINSSYYNEKINQSICRCELIECKACSIESLNKNLYISCNNDEGYYPTYDDLYNDTLPFYKCHESLEGYYFDNETSTFKLCYKSCKKCEVKGNEITNNCLECKINYRFEIHFDKYKNCYDNCSSYYYLNEINNEFFCTNNSECPITYNKLIEDKRECIYNCEKDDVYNKSIFYKY